MQKLLYSKSWLYKIKLNSFSTSNQVCSVKVILSNSTVCTSHMRNTSGNSKEMWKLKIMSTKQFFTKSEQVLQETILASWWWFCNRVGFRWKVVGELTGWLASSVIRVFARSAKDPGFEPQSNHTLSPVTIYSEFAFWFCLRIMFSYT